MKNILFTIGLLICSNLVAQKAYKFNLELGSGIEYGQWSINLGDIPYSPVDLYYKTEKEFSIPLSISAAINLNRINLGIEAKYNWFLVSEMYCTGNSDDTPCYAAISNKNYVNLATITIFAGYDIVYREVYRFSPRINYGTFLENSTSPVELPSGPYIYYRIDLRNQFHVEKIYFSVSPSFSKYHIGSYSENFRKGTHKINHIGLLFGCGISL